VAAASSFGLGKLTRPAQLALGGGFAALMALAYWLVFYADVSSKITSARGQSVKLEGDLGKAKESQASYFADHSELLVRQQRQPELNKALPADTEAAAFLSSLQQVSNVSGLDLLAWQPIDEKADTFFVKVPMKLELSGRFQQIAKFSYEVGKLERIINLENIELTDPKLVGDEVKVKAHFLATTFHVPHAAPPAASSAARPPTAPTPPPAPPPLGGPR